MKDKDFIAWVLTLLTIVILVILTVLAGFEIAEKMQEYETPVKEINPERELIMCLEGCLVDGKQTCECRGKMYEER